MEIKLNEDFVKQAGDVWASIGALRKTELDEAERIKLLILGKLVKLKKNRGWNKGYIVDVGVSAGAFPQILVTVSPTKQKQNYPYRTTVDISLVEFLSDKETQIFENQRNLDIKINNRK
jgi:hypothetical protein